MEFLLVVMLLAIVLFAMCIKIVPEGHRGTIERLGHKMQNLEPGLHVIIPFIDKIIIEKR